MRQTKGKFLRCNTFTQVAFILMLLTLISGGNVLYADIAATNPVPKLAVDYEGAANHATINGNAIVTLTATWKGDTPPYSVSFKSGGKTIGNDSTSGETATIQVSGSALGHGDNKTFSVDIIESSVPGAKPGTANGDKTVSVDLTAPTITVGLNGSVFSGNPGNNHVVITVTSNENIRTPVLTIEPSGLGVSPTPDPGNQATGTSFIYTLDIPNTATNGNYTVRAVCKDTTNPADGANTGTGLNTFSIKVSGPGAGSITGVTPASPMHVTSFTLNGTTDPNMDNTRPVEVLEGGAVKGTGSINSGNWTVGLNGVAVGSHTYTMRGYDNLGNPSAESAPFEVIIDTTSPSAPTLKQPTTPTNADTITIEGTGAVDSGTVISTPVTIGLFDGTGAQIASTTAAADGSFSFSNVTLNDGQNQFYTIAADATSLGGNKSGVSNWITVVKDSSSTAVGAVFISNPSVTPPMASSSIPLANTFQLGAGTYYIEVRFGKNMDINVNPQITLQTAGGTSTGNSNGTWIASDTFVGSIAIPENGGTAYDGAANIRVSNAKDSAGNDAAEYVHALGTIDCTNPTSSFDSTDDIYVASVSTTIPLKGVADDNSSGVGYIELIWQEFDNPASIASHSIPFFNGPHIDWTYDWDTSSLAGNKYKIWVIAADKSKPTENKEKYASKPFRTVYIDRGAPTVTRISLGNSTDDLPMAPLAVISSDVVRLTAVASDTGSGLDFTKFTFTLKHDESGNEILGTKANNGNDTIYFDFDKLTTNGTYTVSVTPVDTAGNTGTTATRSFIIDTEGPSSVHADPPNNTTVNETYPPIAQNEVWGIVDDASADYTNSTMVVRYNGNQIGGLNPGASTTAIIWNLASGSAGVQTDQSWDGRYDVEITPQDSLGNTGVTTRSFFNLDTQAPVITTSTPDLSQTGTWVGLGVTQYSVTLSDSPKDIVEHAAIMGNHAVVSGDPTWYNGSGSGVNMGVSSFTWTAGTATPTTASIVGNTFTIPRPVMDNAPEGVVDVNLKVVTADKVALGTKVPNTASMTSILKFDYLPPQIDSITKPDPANNKYCKDTVTVKGLASDQGTSNEVQVTGIEIKDDSGAWQPVATTGLPAKSASITATINIKDKPDGTYNVDLRAIDKGSNYSAVKTTSFVVDRTPPPVPALTIPLPDMISNKRGHLFKWVASTGADHYLLQVADDASFNNILNNQPMASYPNLLGAITVMTENSFAIPKDGTFYWRVAAIETCVDGFNISAFSTSRKLVVDSVRPTIVSVLPAPSSGNQITTGMVSFTIRFSEKVDTSVPPTVKLTSSGGEVMKIEMSSYSEDTWVGTTVIPSDHSSTYDGKAVISIEDARDLAGNIMSSDSTHSVVVNTGPAFTTKIFSNPAHEYEIMVVTKSSEALQTQPTCSIQQSSNRTPVLMNFLKERYYAGSYKIIADSPGKAYIDLSGTDLNGMVGHDYVQFVVADLSASKRLDVSTPSGLANLKGAEGSAFTNSLIFMLPRERMESPFNADIKASSLPGLTISKPRNGSELVGVMPLEEISPASLRLKKCLLYTADVKNMKSNKDVPADKIHLYRLGPDGFWRYQGGEIKDGKISAQLTGLGRLALMADMTSPSVRDLQPADMADLDDPQPTIEGQLVDYGSGIVPETFKLFIDGREIKGIKADLHGNFKYKVPYPLPKGKHEIEIAASDKSDNTLRKSFWVTAPGAFAIDEFMPYPNPVRGNHMMFNYNFNQTAERVRLKIYDTAGHKVTDFDTFDFANTTHGRIRWDLRNNNGRKVANGVYFYKLQITKNGKTFKKRGKFAVMN